MRPSTSSKVVPALAADHRQALQHLLEASQAALALGSAPSAFACQLTSLHGLSLTDTVMRWLIAKGLVAHSLETTKPRQQRRTFRRSANLRFTARSCFLLTDAGSALAARLARLAPRWNGASKRVQRRLPHYDADRRTLFVGSDVVKQFKVRAENQELILMSFEEENWPAHLSDPLPGKKGMDAKRRLNSAIRNLNANQITPILRFHGDGTGTGIVWNTLA